MDLWCGDCDYSGACYPDDGGAAFESFGTKNDKQCIKGHKKVDSK